jgi:hypothetical protein
MGIDKDETVIIGSWVFDGGRMIEDGASRRIRLLIGSELHHIATSEDGWEKLYRDPKDGRYWELYYPQSEQQGAGPVALRVVAKKEIQQKYGEIGTA